MEHRGDLKVVTQIVGLGEEVIGIEIGIILQPDMNIKKESELIISVKISFNTQPETIQIVQSLLESERVENYLKLQDVLWIMGKQDPIQVIQSSADIYYIGIDA